MKLWVEKSSWAAKTAHGKAERLQQDKIKSIAVIRHAALGDMVLVRAFIRELRKHFPNAKITLSVVSNYLRGTPEDAVDRVHVVIGSDQREVPRREQFRRMKELGYHDLVFDLAATSRSFWTCLLNPAGLKIGFPYRHLQRRLIYDATVVRSDMKFEAESMMDMLSLLCLKTDYPLQFDMPGETSERPRPYVVYFTSASTPDKCWPKDHFAKLLHRLSADYPGHDHLVLEGIADWESIDEIIQPLKDRSNVAGINLDSVEETVNLLKGANLLISNDTGIRNLAIATETPTVGIFFKTIPFRYWPRYPQHDAVFNSTMTPPEVEDVYHAAKGMLDRFHFE